MAVKASSQVTLVDVSDSYSVTLTSEAYTFTGGTGGAASGLTCTTQALAFCGTTQCTSVSITASAITCPTGIKAAVTNNNTSAPTVTFTTTATITASCEATIPVVVNGITINKKFSFAVAKTGATGATGATGSTAKRAGAIKASAAITAGNLIVGNSSGYHHLKTGGSFDISYGVLYADSAISSGSTGINNYSTINFTVTTTQSISLTAYKAVYIKGKLAGPTFTPISTAPLTQTVPTSADGYYYMLVGTATSTTTISLGEDHAVYRYLNGKFQAMGSTADETVLNWCKGTDLTYIDGGKLYANSVTAAKIDVDDLFAQNITATNMHITGDSTFDGDITARSLTLGDGTKVHMEWGTDTEWGSYAAEIYYNNNNNPYCGIEVNIEGAGIHTYAKNSSGTITSQADVSLEASGYAYITATKGLAVRGYAHPQITCKRYASDTNAVSFGVGSGGTNRGVFDETNSKWMLHTDGSKLYLDNDVCMTLQTSGFFRKFGRVVVCRIYGTLTTALGTIPSAYRPVENMSAPATILYNSNGFSAYVVFTTSGSITSKFYKDAEAPKDPASGCKIYCDAVWIAAS